MTNKVFAILMVLKLHG